MLLLDGLDLLLPEEGEHLEVAHRVLVGAVDEVLVELVGARELRVEEEGPVLRLPELLAVRPRDEPHGHRRAGGFLAPRLPDELEPARKVPPLVVPAHLDAASLGVIEPEEVHGLEDLVAELGEGDAGFKPRAHDFLRKHVVHGEVLPVVAEEVDEGHLPEPVVVVEDDALPRVLEVEEALQLGADARRVRLEGLLPLEVPLLALPGRVADHAGRAPDEGDDPVAGPLEAHEERDHHEVPQVHRGGRGVEAAVDGLGGGEKLPYLPLVAELLDQPAPPKFVDNVFHTCLR